MKLNNPRMAIEDLRAAMARQPDGQTAACIGDCLSRLSYHEEALQYYSVATHMGFTSAGMLNNVGYCCLQRHRLEEAVKYLSLACERDPLLQPAHLNLAVAYLGRAFPDGHVDQAARFHIEKAISLGPPSVDLFQIAAILSMSAAKDDPAGADRALWYLEKARLLGLGDQEMLSRPEYQSLRRHPQFKRLLKRAPGVKPDLPSSIVDSL
jgi:TPR repeat protein